MKKTAVEWQVYRSKFLYRVKRLKASLVLVDPFGHEHRGKRGDYLVESECGLQRIWPRLLFENAYVKIDPAEVSLAHFAGESAQVNSTSSHAPVKDSPSRSASCGKGAVSVRIPAVNSLRYNM